MSGDNTDWPRKHERTTEEAHSLETAEESPAHAVYVTDADGDVEFVNETYEQLTGESVADATGSPPTLLPPDDDIQHVDPWETARGGNQWQGERHESTESGERVVFEQTISPVSGADGTEKFVGVAQDISERKVTEHRLERQRDDLDLLNHVLRHDIRNHLQLVSAYADFLEDHVDEEGREYLDTVRESAKNAIALTSTAKDMADVMLQTTADHEPVELDSTLTTQVHEIRDAHPQTVVTVDGPVPAVSVMANDMLSSVFRNVLKNAIQHNDKPTPELTVSFVEAADAVTIRFADNGPGIPDAQKPEIFGKGEKGLDSAGTGIGLYLVKSLVESYGGDVWVEDNDPVGSVFVVELPTVGE